MKNYFLSIVYTMNFSNMWKLGPFKLPLIAFGSVMLLLTILCFIPSTQPVANANGTVVSIETCVYGPAWDHVPYYGTLSVIVFFENTTLEKTIKMPDFCFDEFCCNHFIGTLVYFQVNPSDSGNYSINMLMPSDWNNGMLDCSFLALFSLVLFSGAACLIFHERRKYRRLASREAIELEMQNT